MLDPVSTVLSAREAEVVRLIAAGYSNRQIARLMFLSTNTIKTLIRTAYAKMHVECRAQAVRWVLERDLVYPLLGRLAAVEAERDALLRDGESLIA